MGLEASLDTGEKKNVFALLGIDRFHNVVPAD
jgi:hypothetical protein